MAESLYASVRKALSQGDIIENVRITEPHLGVPERTFSVMVLSHGCEVDKKHNKVMLVANVRRLSEFSPADHEAIRNGQNLSLFYLPADSAHGIADSCVDLRQVFRVAFSSVGATAFELIGSEEQRVIPTGDSRRLSLSDYGVAVLHGRIVAFFTRSRDFEAHA